MGDTTRPRDCTAKNCYPEMPCPVCSGEADRERAAVVRRLTEPVGRDLSHALGEALDAAGLQLRFGLSDEQRRDIVVRVMRGDPWSAIAKVIGWHEPTLREWWERDMIREVERLRALLADAAQGWRNDRENLRFQSPDHGCGLCVAEPLECVGQAEPFVCAWHRLQAEMTAEQAEARRG